MDPLDLETNLIEHINAKGHFTVVDYLLLDNNSLSKMFFFFFFTTILLHFTSWLSFSVV